jgi:TolB-like protein
VLPFIDMSEKKDQEYLADGMAEEILNLLAKAPDLLVPARTSSFYFKGKSTKIPEIARELGVAHVLEGSIRRVGDHLRVTAQLVRADNGYHLWSDTYDREMKDLFQVQDDIANAVVQALQIKLMGGELRRQRGGTQNLDAYQLYLRADNALMQNTSAALDAAYEYSDQAIKLDPNYGMAWLLWANTILLKTENGLLDPNEGYERARQATQHALQLSPELAEAHALLQSILMSVDRDWAAAEAEGQRARAIDPTAGLQIASLLSIALGRWTRRSDNFRRRSRAIRSIRTCSGRSARPTTARVGCRNPKQRFESCSRPRRISCGPARTSAGRCSLKADRRRACHRAEEADEGFRAMLLPSVLRALGRDAEADEALKAQIEGWATRCVFRSAELCISRRSRACAAMARTRI